MFFDPGFDWLSLEPHEILALRACAPDGVFTETAKGGYLTHVSGHPLYSGIANCLFGTSDYEFIIGLPESQKKLKPELVVLMHLVYRHGIRPADRQVKNL